ncbi:MAG: hypothetical protein M1396_03365 [Chloroflexi bacterium]|nr:hypothetical protein [Chloroflexota bacterium]
MIALTACGGQRLVDTLILTPTDATPQAPRLIPVITPVPTATVPAIAPKPMAVNLLRQVVKPGEDQQIEVTGTPETFIDVIVRYPNGAIINGGTHLGAQVDLNGLYIDRWTLPSHAPGGVAQIEVVDTANGQKFRASFTIHAPTWGPPPRELNPPIEGYVPYGTPNAPLITVTPVPTPPLATLVTPQPVPTAPSPTVVPASVLHLVAFLSPATVKPGQSFTIVAHLRNASSVGVAGAHLFAVGHFPNGAAHVWIGTDLTNAQGQGTIAARADGATSGSVVTVDVFATFGGKSYQTAVILHIL